MPFLPCFADSADAVQVFLQDAKYEEMLNKVCKTGQTPLHKACNNGNVRVVVILVSAGRKKIEFNAKDNNGYTGFMLACQSGDLAIVRELVEKVDDLDTNAKNTDANTRFRPRRLGLDTKNYGQTGFMLACQKGHLAIVRELVEKVDNLGTSVKDSSGRTGFILACMHGHLPVVQQLLNLAKCDTEAEDDEGRTGCDLAVEMGKSEVADLIRQHRASKGE